MSGDDNLSLMLDVWVATGMLERKLEPENGGVTAVEDVVPAPHPQELSNPSLHEESLL